MLLVNTESRKAGGNVVTYSLTSSLLESRMTRKRACPVRGRAVAKVPQGNSVAAYPTVRAQEFSAYSPRIRVWCSSTVRCPS